MNFSQKNPQQQGFTLIEILIAIAVLATMGTLAAQSIQQAIKQKKKIQEQVDITSRMRDGMRLLERDIQLAYHHRDWEKELMQAMKKKAAQAKTPGKTGAQVQPQTPQQLGVAGSDPFSNTPVEAPRVDPVTHFMGSENEIHFVTMNNARLSKNTIQADHIEVGYSLKECKSVDGKTTSKCLWRRSSPWVDRDVTKDGEEVVLLEDISEFSLRYLGKGKQDWVKDWKTNEAGDGATKGNFPTSVEISLTLEKAPEKSTKKKKYSMQVVVPIHFPNNLAEGETDPNNPNALPPGSVPGSIPGGIPGGAPGSAAGQPGGG